jgi:hypothetical protein
MVMILNGMEGGSWKQHNFMETLSWTLSDHNKKRLE